MTWSLPTLKSFVLHHYVQSVKWRGLSVFTIDLLKPKKNKILQCLCNSLFDQCHNSFVRRRNCANEVNGIVFCSYPRKWNDPKRSYDYYNWRYSNSISLHHSSIIYWFSSRIDFGRSVYWNTTTLKITELIQLYCIITFMF